MNDWHSFAMREIDNAIKLGRRLTPFEDQFLNGDGKSTAGVRRRIGVGYALSEKQEAVLLKIHQRLTDVRLTRR